MPEEALVDTQKKQFFRKWENFTFGERAVLVAYAFLIRARRHYQSLKSRFLI